MNFRDLVTRLDLIEDAGLTLATVQAAEHAAKEKASVEKTKGGWSGFTSWDPKTAGNIAVAKLAQQNRLEGLFNSEGDFIIAYGDNEWSSKEGQAPRVAPPTPEDWKPLASRGLIPNNAKGPAGLTNWLTGGKSQDEFKAGQRQSADVIQAALANPSGLGLHFASDGGSDQRVNGQGLTMPAATANSEVPASKSLDPGEEIVPRSGSGAPSEKAKEVDDLLKQYVSMDDNSKEDQVVAEDMHKSLIESFGYTVNEGFWDTTGKVLSHPGTMIGLGGAVGALGDERTNAKVGLGNIKWDEDLVPGIPYTARDALIDAGITAGSMAVGAFGGPVGATAAAAANASRVKKIISVASLVGKKFTKTMVGTAIPAQLQFNIAQEMAHAVKNMYKSKDDCDIQMPDQPPVKNPC